MTRPLKRGAQANVTRIALVPGPLQSPIPWRVASARYPTSDHLGYPTMAEAVSALKRGHADFLLVSAHAEVPDDVDYNELDAVETEVTRMPRIGLALSDYPSVVQCSTLFHAGRAAFLGHLAPYTFQSIVKVASDEDAIHALRNQRTPSGAIVNELTARQLNYPLFRTLRDEYPAAWVLYRLVASLP